DRLHVTSGKRPGLPRRQPRQGRKLETISGARRKAPAVAEHIEQHVLVAPMGALHLVRDVERLGENGEILHDVVAGAEIDLQALVDESRLRPEGTGVLYLTET